MSNENRPTRSSWPPTPNTDPRARAAALAARARTAEAPATVAALTGKVHSLYQSQPTAEQANCLG